MAQLAQCSKCGRKVRPFQIQDEGCYFCVEAPVVSEYEFEVKVKVTRRNRDESLSGLFSDALELALTKIRVDNPERNISTEVRFVSRKN